MFLFLTIFVIVGVNFSSTAIAGEDSTIMALVQGSPWTAQLENKKGRKKKIRLLFSEDGQVDISFNGKELLTTMSSIDKSGGISFTTKKGDGKEFEFSFKLDEDGNLSGNISFTKKGGWREKHVVFRPTS
ncbi:MAG TPA: hypothetical protein ENI63_00490 [Candidatus Kaiserbacteria bacterium]|nr:hypothetical protein [Candidatus Kaiserbacteria bacterium]